MTAHPHHGFLQHVLAIRFAPFVEAPNGPDLPMGSITLDAWIKPNSNTQPGVIISKYDTYHGGTNGSSWILSVKDYDGSLRFVVYGPPAGGRGIDTPGGLVLVSGEWNHIAATFDLATQEMAIYLNGVQIPTIPISGFYNTVTSINDTNAPVWIGSALATDGPLPVYGPFFDGLVDEVEIFGRALAASEIQAIYDAGSAGKCKVTPTPPPFVSPTPTPTATPTSPPPPLRRRRNNRIGMQLETLF